MNEFALLLPLGADVLIERLADEGFLAGISLDDTYTDARRDGLLVAVTERRTRAEIDSFADSFTKAL
jgi:glycine cleavage system pyridoxal-binding protein P